MKSKINVKQEQRIGKFVRDFSIVVQDERSVNYNILRNMLRELLNSQSQPEEKTVEERMKEMEIPYMETAKLEELNENERRKRDKLAMDMLDNAYKLHYVKDTPGEWRELKEILDEYTIYADCFPFTPDNAQKSRVGIEKKIQQLLDDREREGYQNCMDDIWEKAMGLRSWTEHDGSISSADVEAGIAEAYIEIEEELDKLNK